MFAAFGIVLLMVGAALTFAVEREVEGVDLQLVGWILMAGGGAALIASMVRFAALGTIASPDRRPDRHVDRDVDREVDREVDRDVDRDVDRRVEQDRGVDRDVEQMDESRRERRSG